MRRCNALISIPVLGLLLLLMAGCNEPGNGACNGNMNGLYFTLFIANYTDEVKQVSMNGRPVGEVAAYQGLDGNSQTVPGASSFKEFPVCDAWTIEAEGAEAKTDKFCSRPPVLDCGGQPDFCTEGFLLCSEIDQDGCKTSAGEPVNYVPAPPQPLCGLCAVGPGEAWERC